MQELWQASCNHTSKQYLTRAVAGYVQSKLKADPNHHILDVTVAEKLIEMLVRLCSGLGKIFYQAFDHLEPLVVLEVHHVLPV